MLKIQSKSEEETIQLAQRLAEAIDGENIVLSLKGPLGSGKTFFAAAFGKALGVERAIKSPTYTIVKEYPKTEGEFIHVDAYRLEGFGGEDLDMQQYYSRPATIVIEWAEYIDEELPEAYLLIEFLPLEDAQTREIHLQVIGDSATYHKILERLS